MLSSNLILELYIFALAAFLGYQLISKVPSVLHTPLMSATNAIHGIILVGAISLAATAHGVLGLSIAMAALILASMNVVGGFVVTDRILEMFSKQHQK
ncbi:MAG: NAD(P) transhydrogenase subunit alpha [Firmicutes bacterium]|nr:NAD(P) transhydrogenase subunit alpha [Bacillota bacterium]